MELSSRSNEYSEEWDTLLNWILDNYVEVEVKPTQHVLEFKILVNKRLFCKDVFKTYGVWVGSKDFSYATLYTIDNRFSLVGESAPKKETMERLYEVEIKSKDVRVHDIPTLKHRWFS